MKIIDIQSLAIPEVKVLRLQRIVDSRGYFLEVFRTDILTNHSQLPELKGKQLTQLNESKSRKLVMRGLHTQCRPNLDKLLRVLYGRIVDVAVDIRLDSPTYGQAVAYELNAQTNENFEEIIFIPFGFAHGIIALEDSHIQYFQTGLWNDSGETTIKFSDSSIDWSLCEPHLVKNIQQGLKKGITSSKDNQGTTLKQWKEMPLAQDYMYTGSSS